MQTNINEKWSKVLNILETEVTAIFFDLWIKTLEPIKIVDNKLYVMASSIDAKNRCLKLYKTELSIAISDVFEEVESFEILSPEEKEEFDKTNKEEVSEILPTRENLASTKFNEKYTFNNFVVGKSNQYVFHACKSVATSPCSTFNPLFIYGGVGLGKTHLLHAIGNYLKEKNPNLVCVYVTCEKFTNDYISSLGTKDKDRSINAFREKYRNVDVLMVDDIQFITNKIETQEEFFNTYNDLYQNNKQIIIASDRPAKEIATLNERLTTRFSSGLTQDVQSPDFETRVAILRKKAQNEGYKVEEEVINYLAEKIDTNIREMEGALAKVSFYASLNLKHFASLEDAKEALKDDDSIDEKEILKPEKILDVVCKYYNVSKQDIIGKKRNKEIVEPRQICIYLINEFLTLPLASIGELLGGRDHTTIIHARDKIAEELKINKKIKTIINDLKSLVLKH